MRILHITYNPDWFKDHFDFLCRQLGHEGETQQISDMNNGEFDAVAANKRWAAHKDYYESFDAVFVSHLTHLSRIFLQNDWKKPLYIWLCFRFDFGAQDREFYRLIKEARNRPNVKFFAASEHDRLYIQRMLGDFPVDIVPPMVYVNNANKVKVPCDSNTFFVMSKHNETVFMNLKEELDRRGISAYKHGWSDGPPDLQGVRGVIHIPYTFLTRALYENLALGNVFFLADENFIRKNMWRAGFFWDLPFTSPDEVSLAEWYREEHRNLFIYFSGLDELKAISEDPNLDRLIAYKKDNIAKFTVKHNEETLKKWGEIFS